MTADEKHASTSFNRQLHEKAILGRASWAVSFNRPSISLFLTERIAQRLERAVRQVFR